MDEKEKKDDFLEGFQEYYQKMQEELKNYAELQEKYNILQKENEDLKRRYQVLQKKQEDLYLCGKDLVEKMRPEELDLENPESEKSEPAKKEKPEDTEHESDAEPKKKPLKKNKAVSVLLDILFYVLLIALVAGAALFAKKNQNEKNDGGIFGYSYYQVLTRSMQSEIPQGSLVLVKQGTENIQVGDDITFMVSDTDVATHRCIEIEDDYNGSGMRAFNTQGVDNPHPDGFTMENNVIGKVVFHVPYLGKILSLIADNLVWFVISMVSVMVLISALRTLIDESMKERKAKKQAKVQA